jgi:hypothetical protein
VSPPDDSSPGATSGATTTLASKQADTQVTALADIGAYLDVALDPTAEGFLIVVVGVDPYLDDNGKYKHGRRKEYPRPWPTDADTVAGDILAMAAKGDVFVCPYILTGPARNKGTAVSRKLVHADVDDNLDLEKVRELCGFAVYSGTRGHAHGYVPLTESVTVPQHEALCRGLGRYLGADDAKISDNDLLRPPGTRNFKSTVTGGQPTAVEWAVRP